MCQQICHILLYLKEARMWIREKKEGAYIGHDVKKELIIFLRLCKPLPSPPLKETIFKVCSNKSRLIKCFRIRSITHPVEKANK